VKRLLVTGGAGFIGANFCRYWSATYPADRLVVLDALTYAGNLASIEPLIQSQRLHFVHGDICDRDRVTALMKAERIDTVVNFAAESHVDRSIEDPQSFLRTNVMGTHALLEAARSAWPQPPAGGYRFHHVSTDEVYGSLGPADAAFTESTAYAPNSPYSASKAAADHIVRAYAQTYGTPCTISMDRTSSPKSCCRFASLTSSRAGRCRSTEMGCRFGTGCMSTITAGRSTSCCVPPARVKRGTSAVAQRNPTSASLSQSAIWSTPNSGGVRN